MSTPTIDQIHRHYSVRRYRPDPVPRDMIETVVVAGQRAATSSNFQTYSVVVVTDAARRERLAALCGDQAQIHQAPVFMAWCADRSRLDRICERRGYVQVTGYVETFLVAAVDAALAMQNATLAAESLGLGTCYIGAIRNRPAEVIELLALPPLVFPISGMTLGWPAVEPFIRPRLPLEAVLHWERYSVQGEEAALDAYDRAMIATGIYDGRQVDAPGRDAPAVYGWQEHSARRVSRSVRTDLRDVLHAQGFALE
jgi:nitroreductase